MIRAKEMGQKESDREMVENGAKTVREIERRRESEISYRSTVLDRILSKNTLTSISKYRFAIFDTIGSVCLSLFYERSKHLSV